jgi:Kef-type K+ transport system membrane component KefB
LNYLIELLILIAAARVAGEIAQRLKQPSIIGELLAGLVLGPPILGILSQHSGLQILADLGMFFLMFVIGMQSSLDNIIKVLKPAILTGFFGTISPLILGYYACLLIGLPAKVALFIGIAFSMTAVAVLTKTLMDIGIEKSKIGQIIIGTSIFDNIFSLILFAILIPASKAKQPEN